MRPVYREDRTGIAPPVFISRRIVFILFIYKEDKHNAMKVKIKGSLNDRECYEF